jgi:hypothetical protein
MKLCTAWCLQVEKAADHLYIKLPSLAQEQHKQALRLSHTHFCPSDVTFEPARQNTLQEKGRLGEALSIPELGPVLKGVKEVRASTLTFSYALASVGQYWCPQAGRQAASQPVKQATLQRRKPLHASRMLLRGRVGQ